MSASRQAELLEGVDVTATVHALELAPDRRPRLERDDHLGDRGALDACQDGIQPSGALGMRVPRLMLGEGVMAPEQDRHNSHGTAG